MLVNFEIKDYDNFTSGKISTLAQNTDNKHRQSPFWVSLNEYELKLNTLTAIFGFGARDKTTIFSSLAFVKNIMSNKAQPSFHEEASDSSKFIAELVLDGVLFNYTATIDKNQIIEEVLRTKTGNEPVKTLALRRFDFPQKVYQVQLDDEINLTSEQLHSLGSSHKQTSFLSDKCFKYTPAIKSFVDFFKDSEICTDHNLTTKQHVEDAASFYTESPSTLKQASSVLRGLDLLGYNDNITIKDSGEVIVKMLVNGNIYNMPLESKCSGFVHAFVLLSKLLPVVNNGGFFAMEEPDSRLHPLLTPVITKLLHSERCHHKAQVVATFYHHHVLTCLFQDQVYITSHAFEEMQIKPVTDFKLRANCDLEKEYFANTFGDFPSAFL